MGRPLKVYTLFVPQIVRGDPPHVNPMLRRDLVERGRAPAEPTIIMVEGGMLIWEPTGEVKKLR